ncbi:MAG: hypothetical protein AVDCRST_MAG06-1874, partial [uncultured Nocardioides sp.]
DDLAPTPRRPTAGPPACGATALGSGHGLRADHRRAAARAGIIIFGLGLDL